MCVWNVFHSFQQCCPKQTMIQNDSPSLNPRSWGMMSKVSLTPAKVALAATAAPMPALADDVAPPQLQPIGQIQPARPDASHRTSHILSISGTLACQGNKSYRAVCEDRKFQTYLDMPRINPDLFCTLHFCSGKCFWCCYVWVCTSLWNAMAKMHSWSVTVWSLVHPGIHQRWLCEACWHLRHGQNSCRYGERGWSGSRIGVRSSRGFKRRRVYCMTVARVVYLALLKQFSICQIIYWYTCLMKEYKDDTEVFSQESSTFSWWVFQQIWHWCPSTRSNGQPSFCAFQWQSRSGSIVRTTAAVVPVDISCKAGPVLLESGVIDKLVAI